jgi:hypothetical protein
MGVELPSLPPSDEMLAVLVAFSPSPHPHLPSPPTKQSNKLNTF